MEIVKYMAYIFLYVVFGSDFLGEFVIFTSLNKTNISYVFRLERDEERRKASSAMCMR